MSVGIGKNISVYSNPETTQGLSSAYERISSGMRINRASDDPAGLALADHLNTQARVFTRGVKNLEEGTSLITLADSAINELTKITSRIVELAEQAANGTVSRTQRESLDDEAQALSDEYTRIIQTTKFNDQEILTSDFGSLLLQAGFGAEGRIQSNLGGRVGTGDFSVVSSGAVGIQPRSVSGGDFNGDGILDLVTANVNSDTISVMLGNGGGTFSAATSYVSGDNPYSATLGDFNGDGDLDIVTSNLNTDNVSVFLGNGDGTFAAKVDYAAGDGARWVETNDFNNDGYLDLVTADLSTDTASVMMGNGDGTFDAPVSTYAIGDESRTITSGDLNGDGNIDLVATSEGDSTISVLLGNGDGTFAARTTYSGGTGTRSAVLGDYNGDGVLDIASANNVSGNISIFIGNGNGTFASEVNYATGSAPRGITAGDFNGDGVLDLVTANSGSDSLSVFIGNGGGGFSSAQNITGAGNGPFTIIADDFTGDGILDLVTADAAGDTFTAYLGAGTIGTAPLIDFSLRTLADARQAIPVLNRKLEDLTVQKGQIASFQSRVDVASNLLENQAANFRAAESLIREVDLAEEVANLLKFTIIQNSEIAVQAQANQNISVVLELLS